MSYTFNPGSYTISIVSQPVSAFPFTYTPSAAGGTTLLFTYFDSAATPPTVYFILSVPA